MSSCIFRKIDKRSLNCSIASNSVISIHKKFERDSPLFLWVEKFVHWDWYIPFVFYLVSFLLVSFFFFNFPLVITS